MTERSVSRVVYWPFLLADLLFLGVAWLILEFGHRPLQILEVYALILCVGAAAWCFLLPFRTKLKMAESENLVSAAEQIKNLDLVAMQISSATTLWQGVQEESARAALAAKEVSAQMTTEAKAFSEFLLKANDTEKNHLRLEIDKLRRAENEWVQILIRILDHTYALHRGAIQSGQRKLIEQIGQFQNACRDTARLVGLVPFTAENSESFDPNKHQVLDGDSPTETSTIAETLATGFTFQGQLVRPALVRLQSEVASVENAALTKPAEKVPVAQTQLF